MRAGQQADPWEAHFRSTVATQKSYADLDPEENVIERQRDGWTGVLFTGDWHYGARTCQAEQLLKDMQDIAGLNLIKGHLGDAIDGFIPSGRLANGMADEVETDIDTQEGVVRWLMKQGGWGADDFVTIGCHEKFGMPAHNRVKARAEALGCSYGGFGVVMSLRIGDCDYKIVARHKWKRESSLNTTNAQRAVDDDFPMDNQVRADAIVLGHLHNGDFQERVKAGRTVIFARIPGYKAPDTYALAGGWALDKTRHNGAPLLLLLNPDRHEIIGLPPAKWRYGLDILARMQ